MSDTNQMRDKIADIIYREALGLKNNDGYGCRRAADKIIATLYATWKPTVKPLVWDDFKGRGAKAQAWGKANYLITKWSDGRFEIYESYPGYQGDFVGEPPYPTLDAAKAAANAHHRAQIMSDLSATPAPLSNAAATLLHELNGNPIEDKGAQLAVNAWLTKLAMGDV